MLGPEATNGLVVRANPRQFQVFVKIVQIYHRHLHAFQALCEGGVGGSAENSIPVAGSQPGWWRGAQFVLFKKNGPLVMRRNITSNPLQNAAPITD